MRNKKRCVSFNFLLSYKDKKCNLSSKEHYYKSSLRNVRKENKRLNESLAEIQKKYGELMSDSLNAEGIHMKQIQTEHKSQESYKDSVVRYVLAALINIGFTPTNISEVLNRFKPIGG